MRNFISIIKNSVQDGLNNNYFFKVILIQTQSVFLFQQIHIPNSFKKDVLFPTSIAEGTLGYSPDRIAKTWQVRFNSV